MKYLGLIGWLEGADNEDNNRLLAKHCFTLLNQLCSGFFSYNGLYYNIQVYFPADMKAIWMNLGYGGGSHCTSHYCWMCCSRSHERSYPSFYKCMDCKRLNKPDGYCYHCAVLTSNDITKICKAYDNPLNIRFRQRFINHPDTKQKSSLKFMRNFLNQQYEISMQTVNSLKIADLVTLYKEKRELYTISPSNINSKSETVLRFLMKMLGGDGLNVNNPGIFSEENIENKNEYDILLDEITISGYDDDIKLLEYNKLDQIKRVVIYLFYTGLRIESAVFKRDSVLNNKLNTPTITYPEKCIICSLHFKLRVGELLMTSLSTDVLIYINAKHDQNLTLMKIEEFISRNFSGIDPSDTTTTPVVKYSIDINKAKSYIQTITMTGNRQDRIMKDSDGLIDTVYSFFDTSNPQIYDRRERIRSVFNQYKEIIRILNLKHDMELYEIDELQDKLDLFAQDYIFLFSSKKITNYIHICLSGHIRYWLKK
jgi:hypothetical protein